MGANLVSPSHLLLVLLVVVLLFGAKKLPEVGRGLGSAMREFKSGITGTGSPDTTRQALDAPTVQAAGRELSDELSGSADEGLGRPSARRPSA